MKNLIRNVWVCLGLMVLPFTASGQQKDNITYVPAQELLLVGKATTEGEYFHRVDTAKYCTMPPTVKKLFTNSAGLAISFTTNSPVIKAKWMVPDNYQLPNLTRVAQKGLDLYIKRDGKWQFAGVGIPGGEVIGVVPAKLEENGKVSTLLDEEIHTRNLSDRKDIITEKSEVLVALPGGVGTLDEIFHVIAAASIGYHRKKVIFYNEYGFYDELLKALHTLEDKGFARQPFSTYYEVANTLNELKEKIN